MRQYRAILVALATAAAAAFGACGDDDDGTNRCERLDEASSNTGCSQTAYECEDGREYSVDCLVTADGYDCQCRLDNAVEREFSSESYCEDPSVADLNEACGWSLGA